MIYINKYKISCLLVFVAGITFADIAREQEDDEIISTVRQKPCTIFTNLLQITQIAIAYQLIPFVMMMMLKVTGESRTAEKFALISSHLLFSLVPYYLYTKHQHVEITIKNKKKTLTRIIDRNPCDLDKIIDLREQMIMNIEQGTNIVDDKEEEEEIEMQRWRTNFNILMLAITILTCYAQKTYNIKRTQLDNKQMQLDLQNIQSDSVVNQPSPPLELLVYAKRYEDNFARRHIFINLISLLSVISIAHFVIDKMMKNNSQKRNKTKLSKAQRTIK
jgi:hypothetical protein